LSCHIVYTMCSRVGYSPGRGEESPREILKYQLKITHFVIFTDFNYMERLIFSHTEGTKCLKNMNIVIGQLYIYLYPQNQGFADGAKHSCKKREQILKTRKYSSVIAAEN
jgi:hypothetical protein